MNRRSGRGAIRETLVSTVALLLGIILIAALVVPQFMSSPQVLTQNLPAAQIAGITNDIERFHSDCGRFPNSLEDLLTKPEGAEFAGWRGPYIKRPAVDPWGRPLNYRIPGIHNADSFDLWSLGPDGQNETGDDIPNWGSSK
ncbi:MAG: type II secretion system protein GspG [Phycisphaerales bacterium]|nr:type II secretion system protein GspG [Phycisphaerales bacterium]